MKFCLDTNIVIYCLKGSFPALLTHFKLRSPEQIMVPDIVRAELLYGAQKSQQKKRNLERLSIFLEPYQRLPFSGDAAQHYADIRTDLESRGHPIGPNDLIIAATARAHSAILVTHNVREFQRVRGLQVADWTQS